MQHSRTVREEGSTGTGRRKVGRRKPFKKKHFLGGFLVELSGFWCILFHVCILYILLQLVFSGCSYGLFLVLT